MPKIDEILPEDIAAAMSATPRNPLLGALADFAGNTKAALNLADALMLRRSKAPIGFGLGELAMGDKPRMLDRLSYGESLTTGGGLNARLDPGVFDLVDMFPQTRLADPLLPLLLRKAKKEMKHTGVIDAFGNEIDPNELATGLPTVNKIAVVSELAGDELPRRLRTIVDSGRYSLVRQKKHDYGDVETFEFRLKGTEDWHEIKSSSTYEGQTYNRTHGTYNPDIATVERVQREGETKGNWFERVELKPDWMQHIPEAPQDGIIWRGISAEEMGSIKKTGKIESTGAYNIGESQSGMTLYSTDPLQAENYANDFAPIQHMASPDKPAYVIGVRDPGAVSGLQGTPLDRTTERGVMGAVDASDIVKIYEGVAYLDNGITTDVINDFGTIRDGGGAMRGASVAWRNVPTAQVQRTVKPTEFVADTGIEVTENSPEAIAAYLAQQPKFDRQRFTALADAQRGAPEIAMGKVQHANGGGVLSPVVEHVGDITHRMSENYATSGKTAYMGYEYVKPKVDKTLDYLRSRYGFAREHSENLASNARFHGRTLADHEQAINDALEVYAKEHDKLPTFNKMQKHAQRAAVAVGRRRWKDAVWNLEQLKKVLDEGPEAWAKEASKMTMD